MADSVASPQSKPRRAASKKQRQGAVSTETENKLARAARSAQRLAQLSGAARDDSTLDLFPDDPTRARLEAMNIDIRQGTLHGFELPDVVLQAVGALDDNASPDKAARRAPRAAKADVAEPVNAQLSGFDIEPQPGVAVVPAGEVAGGGVDAAGAAEESKASGASGEAAPEANATAGDSAAAAAREQSAPLASTMAATVARSVTALRQATEAGAAAGSGTAPAVGGGKPSQRFAATSTKAAVASREAPDSHAGANTTSQSAVDVSAQARDASVAAVDSTVFTDQRDVQPNKPSAAASTVAPAPAPAPAPASLDTPAAFATPWRDAHRAEPELDRARATAFADTVDALYGVIADQRRAATDHSRRMKWMLSIVVGALLVTVAIGVAQTLLLMRLTRETTAQQQRIEQMMQNQQAAMVSLLDAHTAVAAATAPSAPAPAATAPVAPQQVAATQTAHGRHSVRPPHGHRAKAPAPTH